MHRDRWRHRSGREHGGAGREANLIFVLPPNVYVGPPPVWDFLDSNFHPCWRKIYLLKLEAAVRAAKEAATTASTSRFVPVTLPAGKAS